MLNVFCKGNIVTKILQFSLNIYNSLYVLFFLKEIIKKLQKNLYTHCGIIYHMSIILIYFHFNPLELRKNKKNIKKNF